MNRLRIASLSILCIAVMAIGARAQENPYAAIAVTNGKARTLYIAATKAIRNQSMTTADRKAVQEYILKCGIAPIATPDTFASDGKNVATYRKNILNLLKLSGAQSPTAHADIVTLCERHLIGDNKKLKGIARSDDFTTASRLNAMLLIADLNESEGKRSAPKPSKAAGAFMTAVVGSNKFPQYLRIAALNGLRRHAACGAIRSKSTVMAVLAILKEEASPGMQPEVLNWQRRLAIETLGLIKAPSLAKNIAPFLMDKDAPLELRCAAAEALGRLKFKPGSNVPPSAIAPVGAVAVAACLREVQRIDAELKSSDGGASFTPQLDRDGNPIVDPIVQKTRRVLLDQLNCVETGIGGLVAVTTGPKKNLANAVNQRVAELRELLDVRAKSMGPQELQGQIANTARSLDQIVN